MLRLAVSLLGPFEVSLDGKAIAEFHSDKVRALLAYLAVEAGRPHRRETLAGLLWPDYPERSARTNLSNALSHLRTVLHDREMVPPCLTVEREVIRFNAEGDHQIDVLAFETLVDSRQWEQAVALYRGSFLEGFSLADSPPFEQWTLVMRERLQRQMMTALEGLAAAAEARGDTAGAQAAARRQLELEPWHEGAHRALMRALALSGERASALAQYETCARILKQELDVAPDAETTQLYQAIREGQLMPVRVESEAIRLETRPPDAFPISVDAARPAPPPVPHATARPDISQPTPISPAGERRLATALMAEVSESAALLDDLGPDGWAASMAEVLHLLEAEIVRFGGQVYERRADGLTALFGVPVAHEDDPERAVLAALAMQQTTCAKPELRLRVGVDTGEAFMTYAQDRQHVVGRALTLARRAGVAAGPGSVLVGANTYRLVRPLFEWAASAGLPAAGGLARPLARKATPGKGRGIEGLASPLVGRDVELETLQAAVERVCAGVGGIVTLVGEAGIGKSRLVAEARHLVADTQYLVRNTKHATHHTDHATRTPLWVEGRCLSYGGSVAYLLWLDVLRSMLEVTPDTPPLAVRQTLRARVQALCPACLDEVYPYLGQLLSLPLEEEFAFVHRMPPESLRAECFQAVERLIACVAAQRPLVMVCEDLHWADPTSLALLQRLLPLVDQAALLLIGVFRPETEHGCWQLKETAARDYRHRHTDLWLDALSAGESQELVGHLLQIEALPAEICRRILAQAEGNPFYVEEILRSLIDGGAIARVGGPNACDPGSGQWRAARAVAESALPDTLHGVLAARIDRLPEETRRVLRLAAVIGRAFPYRVLAEIVPSPPMPSPSVPLPATTASPGEGRSCLTDHLLILQRQQLIRERARLPELEYIFKHELTREAAYDGLLKQERVATHRQVAETLERLFPERAQEMAGLLAHHWERAEEPDRAVECLLKAGEQARLAYANEEAIDSFRRALALLERPDMAQHTNWRLAALYGLGTVLLGVGRVSEVEDPLREAIALGKETGLEVHALVRLYYWLGEVFFWQSQHSDLDNLAEEGLALLKDDPESVEGALMMGHLAAAAFGLGDPGKYQEWAFRTAQFVERLPYVEELRPVYFHIVESHQNTQNVEAAIRWTSVFERKARQHHDLRGVGDACRLSGWNCRLIGDLIGALPAYRQALEIATQIGDAKAIGWERMFIGSVCLELGDLAQAQSRLEKALETVQSIGPTHVLIRVRWYLGLVALGRGRHDEAVDHLLSAVRLAQETNIYVLQAWTLAGLGYAYGAKGEHLEAARLFQEALELRLSRELPDYLACVLIGLEATSPDLEHFRAFCDRYRQAHPEVEETGLAQWYLEPVDLSGSANLTGLEYLALPGWTWHDRFSDCACTMENGLVIRAANGRDLWGLNRSAPRLVRPTTGDVIVQTICCPALDDRPGMGGLLLWADEKNYLRLGMGEFGKGQVILMGCLDNKDVVIGRGSLPGDQDDLARIHLRLERNGDRVNAFCSTDGEKWYAAGHTTWAATGPLQVGVYAIGSLNPAIYPGAYPEGTAIRFESFQMWQGNA
ncbi:MAG: AAA family ATPase [Anaerolineae bacterium]|nr:AAA family ATPase [Anaerolineae bacterium]